MFFGNIFWDYFLNKKAKQEDDNEKEVSMGSPQQIITKQAVLQKRITEFGGMSWRDNSFALGIEKTDRCPDTGGTGGSNG